MLIFITQRPFICCCCNSQRCKSMDSAWKHCHTICDFLVTPVDSERCLYCCLRTPLFPLPPLSALSATCAWRSQQTSASSLGHLAIRRPAASTSHGWVQLASLPWPPWATKPSLLRTQNRVSLVGSLGGWNHLEATL